MSQNRLLKLTAICAALVLMLANVGCQTSGGSVRLGYDAIDHSQLTSSEIGLILKNAEAAANKETSLLRVDASGEQRTCRMHIIVMNRYGKVIGRRSMDESLMESLW